MPDLIGQHALILPQAQHFFFGEAGAAGYLTGSESRSQHIGGNLPGFLHLSFCSAFCSAFCPAFGLAFGESFFAGDPFGESVLRELVKIPYHILFENKFLLPVEACHFAGPYELPGEGGAGFLRPPRRRGNIVRTGLCLR